VQKIAKLEIGLLLPAVASFKKYKERVKSKEQAFERAYICHDVWRMSKWITIITVKST
jgi:hypothetical protein